MKIKVLGTVSPHCNKNKNCPGYLVECNNHKILLDCGNGITSLLDYPYDITNLTIIISHLHRDHYADLFSLAYDSFIYHKLGYLDKKIKVYIPEPDYYEVKEYFVDKNGWGCSRSIKKEIIDYTMLMDLGKEQYLDIVTYNETTKINILDTTITFSKNPHNIKSYSTKVAEHTQSIVYSGDTGYLGNTLEKFAIGTNLLICESTFLYGQIRENNYHLYAYEAASIASIAKPEKLLLTHFWPDLDI